MEFITQLFTQLDHTDSITVLAFLFGAFLIGLIFGRRSLSNKLKKARTALKSKTSELSTLSIEHGTLRQNFEQREVELKKLEAKNKSYKESFSLYEQEKNQLNKDLFFEREQTQKANNETQQYINQIALLEGELDLMKTTIPDEPMYVDAPIEEELVEEVTEEFTYDPVQLAPNTDPVYDNSTDLRLASIEAKLTSLESENSSLKTELSKLNSSTTKINTGQPSNDTELRYINLKLERLQAENTTLKKQINDLFDKDEEIVVNDVFNEEFEEEEDVDFSNPDEIAMTARQRLEKIIGKQIPKAAPESKDDLKAINGIGPFIEQKLNTVGIFTFEQISEFDDDLIQLITDAIQFFPGRIKRDEWVQQADDLKGLED